ncbi:MAG: sialate O-acetylesterase [Fibrobacteria bacterium]
MSLKKLGLYLLLASLFRSSPAQAITLGGVEVPKEKFIVYLLIGHSNMAGVDLKKSDPVSIPQGWNWPIKTTRQWVPAAEPVGVSASGLSGNGCAGTGMPFIKAMAKAYPGYYFGALTNASVSCTCRGENTGNNNSGLDPLDNRYYDSTYLFNQIITAAKAVQKDVTFGGVVCMLGTVEATRTDKTVCNAFSDDLATLAKAIRRELGLPNLPFIMGEYEADATGTFAPTLALPAIIQAQIKLLPGKLPFSTTINTVGVAMLDDHHYKGDVGQLEFAQRIVDSIRTRNLFPGASTSIGITTKRAPVQLQGPWLRAEKGHVTLQSGEEEYRVNGAVYRPALVNSNPDRDKAAMAAKSQAKRAAD